MSSRGTTRESPSSKEEAVFKARPYRQQNARGVGVGRAHTEATRQWNVELKLTYRKSLQAEVGELPGVASQQWAERWVSLTPLCPGLYDSQAKATCQRPPISPPTIEASTLV